jgi:uncharacterized membrane protein YGL010W
LGWLRFVHAPDVPYTGATLFYLVIFLYYLCLDWKVALCQAPFTLALLWLADRVALWPFAESLLVLLATFLGGWAIQLIGHAFEGRRPALADNLLQIFNAPLFLTVEVAFLLGLRQDLRAAAERSHPPALATDNSGTCAESPLLPTGAAHVGSAASQAGSGSPGG